jgi:hypothetical protein
MTWLQLAAVGDGVVCALPVFLGSSCAQRNGQKRDKPKNRRKKTTGDRGNFFFPHLSSPPKKTFFGVFELPVLRNAHKK